MNNNIITMNQQTVTTLFGNYASDIKKSCVCRPPQVISDTYGTSEELGFINIIRDNCQYINVLHKTFNPEYIKLYNKHCVDPNNYEFTTYDRTYGDFYLNGYRIDLKVASQDMVPNKKNPSQLPTYVAGSIPMTSLYDFHQDDGLSMYICVSKDWKRMFVVSADLAWDYVVKTGKYTKSIENIAKLKAANKPMVDPGYITVNQLPQYCWVEII